jgi:D-2-hydroxyacid dehydrogenase (NADP+)
MITTNATESNIRADALRVLILHNNSRRYLSQLRARFPEVRFEVCTEAGTLTETTSRFKAQVVFSWSCPGIPLAAHRAVLLQPGVQWVHVAGAGIDHLMPLEHLDAQITNCSGVLSRYMAETVITAMLMFNFGFPRYIAQQQKCSWREHPWTSLSSKTVLILGLGNIGRQVAAKSQQFGLRVLGVRSHPMPTENVDQVLSMSDLHDALEQADFICLHLPKTSETIGLIGADEFARMKPNAVLINTARGGIVKEHALIDALRTGSIAGAYLDVFEHEPLPPSSALWQLDNVVISPHMSDSVANWEDLFSDFFADNLERWLADEPLKNTVDVLRGY